MRENSYPLSRTVTDRRQRRLALHFLQVDGHDETEADGYEIRIAAADGEPPNGQAQLVWNIVTILCNLWINMGGKCRIMSNV
ncbi:hypothetical protein ABE38_03350 [Brevibacillus agri]|nr:hypothetical protein [Brevibacillus agri]